MVRRYDGAISDVHYEVMYLKQIQMKPNVYMFRVLTKFSVNSTMRHFYYKKSLFSLSAVLLYHMKSRPF